eukprot:gnl/MRDRNA2_/MRDRNA2_38140_c0_seq2.p1 gnl/MRDRNA2_/MRDRNA2_38140_c0~~gnl/MRDRNA2_/MRDRNA2_38140_c0_seq2.p1  ORF type:complete len:170 (+),score=11.18 gnl/MRDRNA2_/MRDRNA2_38140_c0_seq2:160-669(+)
MAKDSDNVPSADDSLDYVIPRGGPHPPSQRLDSVISRTGPHPPSQPGQLTATALTSHSCHLSWSASRDDGGTPVEKFLVHAIPKDPGFVYQCAEVPFQAPGNGKKHATFTRVSEGYVIHCNRETRLLFIGLDSTRYRFEVQAVNRIGASTCSMPSDLDLSLEKSFPSTA